MALCAALLLLRRPQAVEWPHNKVLQRLLVLVITLVLYAWGFEWLGFPLATALLTFSIGLLFRSQPAGGGHFRRRHGCSAVLRL